MSLTDTKIRNIKVIDKAQKLYDERGLFLYITSAGAKYWRFKYHFNNKEKLLALGMYPDVSLAAAREKRDEARKQLSEGIDPSEYRKMMKAISGERGINSFEAIAREWFVKYSSTWVPTHRAKLISRLERDVFPWLGDKPIGEITPPILLKVLRQIEARGVKETVHRVLSNCSQIFRYAIASGRVERDPTQDLRGALLPIKSKHFAAQTEPQQFGALLRMIDSYKGTNIVRCALQFTPLVFVRPGELRTAQWEDIDFDKAEWRYLVTKTDTPHIVPLATQAIAILQELQPLTGRGRYVFPSAYNLQRPMSENAILGALRRLGIGKEEATAHGFRATARTLLDEVLGFRPDFIEHQLAHAVRDPNGRAYNRTAHLAERKKMMQAWADYLDELKANK